MGYQAKKTARAKETTRKKLPLTPWYVGVHPMRSRRGWYEVMNLYKEVWKMYWDGEGWYNDIGVFQTWNMIWRGVAR